MKLFDKTLNTLENALDARLARHGVLAGNISNADTPGFTPKEMSFQEALRSAEVAMPGATASAGTTSAPTIPLESASGVPATIALAGGLPALPGPGHATGPGIDGNGVDLDKSMVALAENSMQYGAAAKTAGKKLAILRYAVTDGNG
jgi:flagellar basal-body rod protein FlgB